MKLSRHDAAIRLDIPLEMAKRNGLPPYIAEEALAELDANPPAWLAQSRANRTGKRPVWATLTCEVCGTVEKVRPKKWWPEFTYVSCDNHDLDELPEPAPGTTREFSYGIGTRFTGVVDA
ncbi:MAG: hypothetical protein ACTIA6_17450 [Pseudoclavibacter sp.]|uniref:hypothetical protein n=1 Tax=Pseudoclavibacter sp. JSM 162008 TaxID=3229855 RepID=UPI00352518E4